MGKDTQSIESGAEGTFVSSGPVKDYPSLSDRVRKPLKEMGMRLLLSSIIFADLEQKIRSGV